MTLKEELRQQLREKLAQIPAEELSSKSLCACRRLFETRECSKAEVIMVFLSAPGEIDTTPLVLRAWQNRKRVVAPKISWNQRRMVPCEIRSLTHDLVVSTMGIREPTTGVPFPIDVIDLIIVPGIAFDEKGNRLGRGRGFYDRFLAHPEFAGVACGLALEEQIQEPIPVDPLDRPVGMLVTDTKVRRFKVSTS